MSIPIYSYPEVARKWRQERDEARAQLQASQAQCAQLTSALERIANNEFLTYKVEPTSYSTGVTDGHRLAAEWAREALQSTQPNELMERLAAVTKERDAFWYAAHSAKALLEDDYFENWNMAIDVLDEAIMASAFKGSHLSEALATAPATEGKRDE